MKTLKHTLSMALLAIASVFGFARREDCHNESSLCGVHPTGMVPFIAEVIIPTRYLAVQKGTAANGVILNTAATRPWGVCTDEPVAIGTGCNVALFGIAPGTLRVRASKAIAVGAKVWTTAGGQFTDAYAAGAFYCGRALSPAAVANDLFELAHCTPVLDASGTTI